MEMMPLLQAANPQLPPVNGGVWVIAPDGTHLGTIRVPEVPANVGWGDDGRNLYITARTGRSTGSITQAGRYE